MPRSIANMTTINSPKAPHISDCSDIRAPS
jgi:hypothetical protein